MGGGQNVNINVILEETPTSMDDVERFKFSGGSNYSSCRIRKLAVEVEPEDLRGLWQFHDKTFNR